MEEKLKKVIKTSKQGIWIVLILNVVINALAIIGAKNVILYFENYWVSIIYMTSLIASIVLYKKEKYCVGAKIVQWAALGNIILQFVQFITYYIITKLITINIFSFAVGTIIPIILLIESLKVIRLSETQNSSTKLTIIAIAIICVVCIAQVFSINYAIKKISSMSNSDSNIDNDLNEQGDETDLPDENVEESIQDNQEKQVATEQVSSYFLGEFSDVIWCSRQAGNYEKNEWGIYYYIENEKIYYKENDNEKQIKTIKGVPVKVGGYINGGILVIKILTNDGKVWTCEPFETKQDDFKIDSYLNKYNIVDIGKITRGEQYEEFYYKTTEGKVINEVGFELDLIKERMIDSYAIVLAEIYVGKDRRISYIQGEYEQNNLKYIGNIKAKRIYYNMNYEEFVPCYIVLGEDDKLYQIVFETNAHLNVNIKMEQKEILKEKRVEGVSYYSTGEEYDKSYFVEFKMDDGTVVTNQIAELYYNAETFNTMTLN